MIDDDEFLGIKQMMGDNQRAQRVLGGDAAGVADHVGVAWFQSQTVLEQDAGIHAGEDGNAPLGVDGKLSQGEVSGEGLVRLEKFVGDGQSVLLEVDSPRP